MHHIRTKRSYLKAQGSERVLALKYMKRQIQKYLEIWLDERITEHVKLTMQKSEKSVATIREITLNIKRSNSYKK